MKYSLTLAFIGLLLSTHTIVHAQQTINGQEVVINELVASNDSTSMIVDAAGEADDWMELYNNTSAAVDLSDVYLSDDPDDLLMWPFPSGTIIPANGYLIVWADEDDNQAGLHCNFKLNKQGDQIILSNGSGATIDGVQFGEQNTNIAFARTPNGTGDFITKTATFNANNDGGTPTATVDLAEQLQLLIYPVPAVDYLQVDMQAEAGEAYAIDLYSVAGQQLMRSTLSDSGTRLDISALKNGFYFLTIRDERGNKTSRKFVKREW